MNQLSFEEREARVMSVEHGVLVQDLTSLSPMQRSVRAEQEDLLRAVLESSGEQQADLEHIEHQSLPMEGIIKALRQGRALELFEEIEVVSQALRSLQAQDSRLVGDLIVEPSIDDEDDEDCKNVNVCGDLAGQVDQLWNIFDVNGPPASDNPYIFNGDIFWDGDQCSMSMAVALFALQLQHPGAIYILAKRPMHFPPSPKECERATVLTELLNRTVAVLPLGVLLNHQVLILHADLLPQLVPITDSPLPSPVSPIEQDQPAYQSHLRQIQGVENLSDPSVSHIRIELDDIKLPDNPRFMVFRLNQQHQANAYYEQDEVDRPGSSHSTYDEFIANEVLEGAEEVDEVSIWDEL
eukprot:TRINITY_DN12113_c0_g1_i4.p1 TRINITY_DN12113_c0_g1~~TRINITY_DN12113_c0_g1_i4.p1  ORF type:complete len:353 (-),score=78.82 TRINITY_DN12113_c0_g1_i4:356-1414(-)